MTLGSYEIRTFTDEEVDQAIAFIKEHRRDLWIKLVDHELVEEGIEDIGWDLLFLLEKMDLIIEKTDAIMLRTAVRMSLRKSLAIDKE